MLPHCDRVGNEDCTAAQPKPHRPLGARSRRRSWLPRTGRARSPPQLVGKRQRRLSDWTRGRPGRSAHNLAEGYGRASRPTRSAGSPTRSWRRWPPGGPGRWTRGGPYRSSWIGGWSHRHTSWAGGAVVEDDAGSVTHRRRATKSRSSTPKSAIGCCPRWSQPTPQPTPPELRHALNPIDHQINGYLNQARLRHEAW